MAQVKTPTGEIVDVEDTDATALHYYRREPGYEVIDDPAERANVAVAETMDGEVVAVVPEQPAASALKPEWVDYALAVDPGNAAEINDMTKDELVERYGGEQ